MDQTTRKLMTMHKILHHREDIYILYVSRKEVGSGKTTRRLHRKKRKTDYSHQKRYWQHDGEENDNN